MTIEYDTLDNTTIKYIIIISNKYGYDNCKSNKDRKYNDQNRKQTQNRTEWSTKYNTEIKRFMAKVKKTDRENKSVKLNLFL